MLSVAAFEQVVASSRKRVEAAGYTPEKLEELSTKLNLSFDEHFALQDAKSLWQQYQMIDLELATHFYRLLGESASVFNKHDFVTKYVFLEVAKNLQQIQQTMEAQSVVGKSIPSSKG